MAHNETCSNKGMDICTCMAYVYIRQHGSAVYVGMSLLFLWKTFFSPYIYKIRLHNFGYVYMVLPILDAPGSLACTCTSCSWSKSTHTCNPASYLLTYCYVYIYIYIYIYVYSADLAICTWLLKCDESECVYCVPVVPIFVCCVGSWRPI